MYRSVEPTTAQQRALLRLFAKLSEQDQSALLAFAEFLSARSNTTTSAEVVEDLVPRDIPRPPAESVIGAIKRLSETYFMIDRREMLDRTASLMSAHVLHGRGAGSVIDELEALFAAQFELYRRMRQ